MAEEKVSGVGAGNRLYRYEAESEKHMCSPELEWWGMVAVSGGERGQVWGKEGGAREVTRCEGRREGRWVA